MTCKKTHVCSTCYNGGKRCCFCKECNANCSDFVEQKCSKLEKPPYVCSGCKNKQQCTLRKYEYQPNLADQSYRETLSESRKGLAIDPLELERIDKVVSPLIKNGQSIHHVFMSNADELMVSEKTAYNYLNAGLFDADITQHFRCQTENFQGCDLPLQKSKRQSDLWEFFAFFPISCLMLLILTHSTPLKREFPHTCKSESKFLNFAVAFTLTNLHLLLQVSKI